MVHVLGISTSPTASPSMRSFALTAFFPVRRTCTSARLIPAGIRARRTCDTDSVKRYSSRDRLRIVAMTGYGDQRTRDLARGAGFDEHLVKPADVGALERVLASLP